MKVMHTAICFVALIGVASGGALERLGASDHDTAPAQRAAGGGGKKLTVVEAALANGDTALVAALVATGLIEAVPPSPKWTLLAPDNQAFCNLGALLGLADCAGTSGPLGNAVSCPQGISDGSPGLCYGAIVGAVPTEDLSNILLGHVITKPVSPRRFFGKCLKGQQSLGTNGSGTPFLVYPDISRGFPEFSPAFPIFSDSEAGIITTVKAKDGFYYSIDTVLNPGAQNP